MSRTEARRRYIEVLIQTMKVYAAGTVEARELVVELEFVCAQIRGQSTTESEESLRNTGHSDDAAGPGTNIDDRGGGRERLRVLSPVSRGGSGEIDEGERRVYT
jgi:hypothetical protein